MNHKIHESISSLATELDMLISLPGNPRVGNVEAIMASYSEFGQVKPIVVRPNDDGTCTVIAGNHQVEAARRLGWSHIAAVPMEADDQRAVAFAIADNRTMELGHTDNDMIAELLGQIADEYVELLDDLQYDAFEIASLEVHAEKVESVLDDGYIPPSLIRDLVKEVADNVNFSVNDDGETKIEAKPSVDAKTAVTTGSTSIGASGSEKAIIQYNLVFDNADQQRKWYSFIRWLKNDPSYDGDTTAERLMNFIDAHSNF
jgi:hypothetical protein